MGKVDGGEEREMKLVQAVKLLRKSAGVVVIGPPRSGTRIISKIIASELDF